MVLVIFLESHHQEIDKSSGIYIIIESFVFELVMVAQVIFYVILVKLLKLSDAKRSH